MADTVADDQRDPPVLEVDDVEPVTTDLQRPGGGLIAHRESVGQIGGTEDRVLQSQCGFALLVDLVHPLQALAEAAGQHGEQGLVFQGERTLIGQVDQTTSTPSGCCRAMPAVPGCVVFG